MTKELYVASTPHETKVAVVEEDQLAEIYFERENEYTLAGSVYKGRVTRVLPGMQSAFVDIGLERDAFLYVSDFLEEQEGDEGEEYDTVAAPPAPAEARPERPARREGRPPAPQPRSNDSTIPTAVFEGDFTGGAEEEEPFNAAQPPAVREEQDEAQQLDENGARRYRGRRRRGRGRGRFERDHVPEAGAAAPRASAPVELPAIEETEPEIAEPAAPSAPLPGETRGSREAGLLPGETRQSSDSGERREPREGRESREGRGRDQDFPGRRDRGDRFGRGERGDRGDRGERGDRGRERGGREPFTPPPGYQPIVLPGESLSKYRHQPAATPPAPEEGTEEKPVSAISEVVAQPEPQPAPPATRETRAADEESQEPDSASYGSSGRIPYERRKPDPAAKDEEFEAVEEVEETPHSEIESLAPEAKRFDTMNVAGVFGGNAAEPGDRPVDEREASREPAEMLAGKVVEPVPPSREHSFGAGVVEEEVMDYEETGDEQPRSDAAGEALEELEEEVLDRDAQMLEAVQMGAEAREDDAVRRRMQAGESMVDEVELAEPGAEEAEDEEGEFEETEEVDEAEVEAGGFEEGSSDRAELRAPGAGPQRGERRPRGPEFDRNQRRGRRGGRRMRSRNNIQRSMPQITDLLKEGQEILVQIAKEPMGKKGARITSHIALPGRFLVYMPTVNHIGVSRKIASDEERQRLKRILLSERQNGGGGFIVRTAAAGADEDDLRADIRFLRNLWLEIKQRSEDLKAPSLIYHDLNLVERILRDQVTQTFSHIWVDNEQEYERIVRFAQRFQPALLKRIKLYSKETPLFEQFGIQEEINKALKSKVWLKSGGYIVINQTEALVAIDVNTGKYVGKTARLEDTIVKTNVDAIKEIVRQIRLRDLGGIIVIDFIDMDERRNRQKVMQALEEALKNDRAPSKVLQFNDFGLVAITRKRVKQSLERTLGSPCPYCTGTGLVKSVNTVANEIWVEMKKMVKHLERGDVILRVNPEVAKALKVNNARWLSDLEELTGRTVIVKSDPTLHQEQFDLH
jgi:Rne/Rng family ribonuclease